MEGTKNTDFVNLHTHSFYSILEAPFSPKEIIKKALELGHRAVAITDRGVGHGFVEIQEAAKKAKGEITPIFGVELAIAKDSRFEKRLGIDGEEGGVVFIAKNQQGYENLLKLISYASLEGQYKQPRVDFELLATYKEGIIVLTGAFSGFLGKDILEGQTEKAEQNLAKILAIFGKDNVYLELCARYFEEQKKVNNWKLEIAQKLNLQLVATSDARFPSADKEESADVLYCIGKGHSISDPHRFKYISGNHFKSWKEIKDDLYYIDDKILEKSRENSVKIANKIIANQVEIKFGQDLLPNFEVPKGETEATQLEKECREAIPIRYKNESVEFIKEAHERLDYELSVISKMGFDAYFLIVADFINYARRVGISVGPGRGSAAGSIVAYLLNITNIDPLKYELLFERFLNPERVSMPDIDIDFSDERRDEVMNYVVERYGTEKVSKVCTFGTLAAKAALKDVGRAYGVDFAKSNAMTKLLPNKPGFTLDDAKEVKEFMDLLDRDPELKKVYEIAHELEGCVRHVSVHACAVIIGGHDLTNTTPIQWAPGTEDVKISQYPYQQLENIGLLKMDFLGLKNLSILEKAVNHIKVTTGIEINLDEIPIDDKTTFQMISNGETTGVFQFESAGMRRYLKELKPSEFEDLVAMNALYRPGPMEYIPQYIKGKHDNSTVKYMHPALEPILKKTYGIAIYQEQVLRIARDLAGFTLGEADILRKAIGKKIMSILEEQRTKFIEGCVKNKIPQKMGEKIFDEIIVPFSGYGFNRSHAVCYARIAYETAYLRANYPVEFMAAMMTTDRNVTDRIILEMNECQNMGIEVLPPSISDSGSYFTVIKEEATAGQKIAKNSEVKSSGDKKIVKKLRFGLSAIKGLGEESVNIILAERDQNGKFTNIQDFAKRIPAKLMNKKTLEALSFSGAFDSFGDRGAIVASLDELSKYAKEEQVNSSVGQISLFGAVNDESIKFKLKNVTAGKEDILKWERDSLGLYVSDHPLRGMADYFQNHGQPIGLLTKNDDDKKIKIHGLVCMVKKIITKQGKNMAILKIEDTTGKIECPIFPAIYNKIPQAALNEDVFIQVEGKIQHKDDQLSCIVDKIKVGNLKAIQNSVKKNEQFVEEVNESNQPFLIQIPDNTDKKKVDKIKKLLIKSKSEMLIARAIKVKVQGKIVELPFKVDVTSDLERKIKAILS